MRRRVDWADGWSDRESDQADLFERDLFGLPPARARAARSVPAPAPARLLARGPSESEAAAPTRQALPPEAGVSPCQGPTMVLDRLEFDKAELRPDHRAILAQLARDIVTSQGRADAVRTVCLVGHTDTTGTEAYNLQLGTRRAAMVEAELRRQIDALSPSLSARLVFRSSSAGEARPVARGGADAQARNRRVEVQLGRQASERVSTIATAEGASALGAAEALAEDTPAPVVFLIGPAGQGIVGTGRPLPVGAPAYTWTVLDPTMARASLTVDSQQHPNRVLLLGLKPGRTTLRQVYRAARGGTATFDLPIVSTGVAWDALRGPADRQVSPRSELARPIARGSGVASRGVVVRFEPAAFWAGKTVQWTFTPQAAVRGTLPAAHSTNLEAQPGFAFIPATRRSVLDANGKAAVRVNLPAISLNSGRLEVASVDHATCRASLELEVPGIVVIDAGHGGSGNLPGSDANHATSTSGVLEKTMTLEMALRTRDALLDRDRLLKVFLTRDDDFNVPGSERAAVAKSRGADVLVSIHFNGSTNATVRGTETFVRADRNGNVNRAEDLALAQRVQAAVFGAIPGGRNRGVADDTQTAVGSLAVLSDTTFGNTAALHPIRACLLEVEFITNATVDAELNTDAGAAARRQSIAEALAGAIVSDLLNQP